MIVLQGKYSTAKVFTDKLDAETTKQITQLVNQPITENSTVRIMPDTHAGSGCTIGTTLTITDKVVPHMVGVDIGCGMETTILENDNIDLKKLDEAVHERIPAGFNIRSHPHSMAKESKIKELRCAEHLDIERGLKSIGTLGGGNHFIELNKDEEGTYYLVVHSGSRNIGLQVADYYQALAIFQRKLDTKKGKKLWEKHNDSAEALKGAFRKLPAPQGDNSLSWLEGASMADYLHDMAIIQEFATTNRKCITHEILSCTGLSAKDSFTTIHNYIDMNYNILRKGAISAHAGERVLIPINMRDGSLLCTGKGNLDWNYSAPHGAGRIMSRKEAKEQISLEDFTASMEGVYSTTVNSSTLDEAPFAYKPMDEIMTNIIDTVTINRILKPVYNFKSSDKTTFNK